MPYKPKKPCAYPGCPQLTYDRYCEEGEYIRSTSDFDAALELAEFKRFRNNKGRFVTGLKLKPFEIEASDDFFA